MIRITDFIDGYSKYQSKNNQNKLIQKHDFYRLSKVNLGRETIFSNAALNTSIKVSFYLLKH